MIANELIRRGNGVSIEEPTRFFTCVHVKLTIIYET